MSTSVNFKKRLSQKAKRQFRVAGKFARKPTSDQIRQRAADIFRHRLVTGQSGDHLSDWLQAERELTRK